MKWKQREREREREREQNQNNPNQLPSKLRKDFCKQCQRNDYIFEDGLCFKCYLTKTRIGIQKKIQEEGLKKVQLEWESEIKPDLKKGLKIVTLFRGLPDQDRALLEKRLKELIQTIEDDLYPGRKSKRNWLIGGAIVLVIITIGLGIWFWRRKKKRDNFSNYA